MMDDTNAAAAKGGTEQHVFQADVARLLHLMVHSIYSDREIFLRELISNAADACEKLRYEAIAHPDLLKHDSAFEINIQLDRTSKTLVVSDNGIGMNRLELIASLGSIASSGTRAFIEKMQKPKPEEDREIEGGGEADARLIGQFGIGFYSAFIVAEHVVVETRRAGESEAWRWTSQGKGEYEIEALDQFSAGESGSRIILHLRDDATEFLESYRIESMVRKNSQAVTIPIFIQDEPGKEVRQIASGKAIWTRPRSEIEESEYVSFYHEISRQFDEPALTIHWRAEGRYEYTVLAFVPGSKPFDLFEPDRKDHSRLYVRRVLISEDCGMLPGWLRFVRLVVDAPDIPLNVSRELIQKSPIFAAIQKAVTGRIVQELSKLSLNDPEKFASIWTNFGQVIKEGLYEDAERRDQLYEICRFTTTQDSSGARTLKDYVAALRPNQTSIYYIAGSDAARLAASPQLEGFKKRGIEVLILSDPVDSFWVSNAIGYDGKSFKSVTQGDAGIEAIPLLDGETQAEKQEVSPAQATFFAFMKQTLADAVADVRPTTRLDESPACLVASDHGLDRRLERILAEHGRVKEISKPVLEVNPDHGLIRKLADGFDERSDKSATEDAVWLIYDEARLVDGELPADVQAFRRRLFRLLDQTAGQT
jgi:molecular chaperone HtpG